jgi:hypothetical protein
VLPLWDLETAFCWPMLVLNSVTFSFYIHVYSCILCHFAADHYETFCYFPICKVTLFPAVLCAGVSLFLFHAWLSFCLYYPTLFAFAFRHLLALLCILRLVALFT